MPAIILNISSGLCKLLSNLKYPKIFTIILQRYLGIYREGFKTKTALLIIATKQALPRASYFQSINLSVDKVIDDFLSSSGEYLKFGAEALKLLPNPKRDKIGNFQDLEEEVSLICFSPPANSVIDVKTVEPYCLV